MSHFSAEELCSTISDVCVRWNTLHRDAFLWRSLCFSCDHTTKMSVIYQVLSDAPALFELKMHNRHDASQLVAALFGSCQRLCRLNMDFCHLGENSAELLDKVVQFFPDLEVLILEGCQPLDKEGYMIISRLQKLTTLNLNHCKGLDSRSLARIVDGCELLEELFIDDVVQIYDSDIVHVIQRHHSKLKVLVIDGEDLTDMSFVQVAKCSRLDCVFDNPGPRHHSRHILDCVFDNPGPRHHSRHILDCVFDNPGPRHHSRHILDCVFDNPGPRHHSRDILDCVFDNRITLAIYWTADYGKIEMTDVGLLEGVGQLQCLQNLQLRRGNLLSARGLFTFLNHCNVSNLAHLDLSECSALNDEGLLGIAKRCQQLVLLSLHWCWDVTDLGLMRIVTHCESYFKLIPSNLTKLTYLNLEQCNNICDEAVVDLVTAKPDLIVINYYGDPVIKESLEESARSPDEDELSATEG
uniref:F-box/LRR-repeat protein 2 n=1 Tax=Timema monikensis TaxID=170555 RepID=A0A7R9E5E6_9NEOP|nr:unnamed protein product [Timema monikensis]